MDTDNIVTTARARFHHETARRALKEKYQAKLIFAHAGGLWRAGPELITLLSNRSEIDLVLLDLYENPVRVNVIQLLQEVQRRWQTEMNSWLAEYETLNKNR